MELAARNYVATPADVERLAGEIIDGAQRSDLGRGTYLRALVATTQAELGSGPRQRAGKSSRLHASEVAEHLKAFQAMFTRFHAACVKVARATVPEPDTALLRSRTGFSRSAGSTVRGYIRAGGDIRMLAAARVTKAALATPQRKRKADPAALRRSAERTAATLEQLAKRLAAADPGAAAEALRPVLARLAVAAGVTENTTRDASKAADEGLAWAAKRGSIYVPVPNLTERRLQA